MIGQLSKTAADRGVKNVVPMTASLTDFTLPEPVDAVFSNAVFHWIPDDDTLFGCLYRAAKPGGRLRAQCGGYGNNAHVLEAVAAVREQARFEPHLQASATARSTARPRLRRRRSRSAGWRDVRASLFESPMPFEDRDEAALYVRTILLRDHVARMPEADGIAYRRQSSRRRCGAGARRTSPTTSASISGPAPVKIGRP